MSPFLLCCRRGSNSAPPPPPPLSVSHSQTRALFCRRSTGLLTTDMSELSSSEGTYGPSRAQRSSPVNAPTDQTLCVTSRLLNVSLECIAQIPADSQRAHMFCACMSGNNKRVVRVCDESWLIWLKSTAQY